MGIFNSSSPALNDSAFRTATHSAVVSESAMTVQGTIHKTLLLVLLAGLGAVYTWKIFAEAVAVFPSAVSADAATIATNDIAMGAVMPYLIGGLVGGLIFSLIAIFSPRRSTWAAPLYAVCEGLCLGALSAMFNYQTEGIVLQAVGLTFAVLLVMLVLYRTGAIKVTNKLRSGIIIATGAIAVCYLATWIIGMFSASTVSFMHDASWLSIGISLFVVGVAAFNFLLDFDFINRGTQMGAPKYMEWYGAFGLMLTLVWLYIELLRLLSKVYRR
ncbi:MAG: Bax inhibitor-1/YccA family protein [Prevotellaceae bacterium]|jgi:uncharacterized YccA/Bax inhibitor family protein|nr:Bax inhibitor-1/YccA family protein [Prevotellaceae bacterium]